MKSLHTSHLRTTCNTASQINIAPRAYDVAFTSQLCTCALKQIGRFRMLVSSVVGDARDAVGASDWPEFHATASAELQRGCQAHRCWGAEQCRCNLALVAFAAISSRRNQQRQFVCRNRHPRVHPPARTALQSNPSAQHTNKNMHSVVESRCCLRIILQKPVCAKC